MDYSSFITTPTHTIIELWLQWYCILGWAIGITFTILIVFNWNPIILRLAYIINGVGWLLTAIAGLTGIWFMGWFMWIMPLSAFLFMRILLLPQRLK